MKTETRNRWKPELPLEVVETLKDLYETKSGQLGNYITSLRDKGWSLSAIATPLDISRERVRQLSVTDPVGIGYANLNSSANGYSVPELPTKPVKPKREVIEPNREVISRLLELQPMAQSVRGKSQKYREQGEEYTRLIASEIQRGVITNHLAKELGITHSALNFRLVRYGYSESNSTAKCYRPIAYSNTNNTN